MISLAAAHCNEFKKVLDDRLKPVKWVVVVLWAVPFHSVPSEIFQLGRDFEESNERSVGNFVVHYEHGHRCILHSCGRLFGSSKVGSLFLTPLTHTTLKFVSFVHFCRMLSLKAHEHYLLYQIAVFYYDISFSNSIGAQLFKRHVISIYGWATMADKADATR